MGALVEHRAVKLHSSCSAFLSTLQSQPRRIGPSEIPGAEAA